MSGQLHYSLAGGGRTRIRNFIVDCAAVVCEALQAMFRRAREFRLLLGQKRTASR